MRSDGVVVSSIGNWIPAQMRLTRDNDVVQTLTPDRSDQPFGNAILPGRGRCNRFVPDAHGTESASDDRTVDAITVPDHVARILVPGECLRDLTRDPFGGWMCRDVDPDE